MTSEIESQDQLKAKASDCLRQILQLSGLNADVKIVDDDGSDISLSILGQDAGCLVGSHGHTLDAIQYLLTLILNKHRHDRLRIFVDSDGYRAKRKETLVKFANTLADEVVAASEEAVTDPLNPMERRIIHTALADRSDVQTYSEGEEPNRYIVISPKISQ